MQKLLLIAMLAVTLVVAADKKTDATEKQCDSDDRDKLDEGKKCTESVNCASGCCDTSNVDVSLHVCDDDNIATNFCKTDTISWTPCSSFDLSGALATGAKVVGTMLILAIVLPIVACILLSCGVGVCIYCCCCKKSDSSGFE